MEEVFPVRRWGVSTDIYWCRDHNVPSRDRECGGLEEGVKLRLAEPADIRPAFRGDLRIIEEAMLNEFGTDILIRELGIDEENTYLNKAPHFDDMKEVVVGGSVVGRLYFDPKYLIWRWRLSFLSAEIAVLRGLVKTFTIKGPIRPLQSVGESQSELEGEQAIVLDGSGTPKALAIAKRGKFRIQSFLKPSNPPIKRKASEKDFMEVNGFRLKAAVSRAVKHVAIMEAKTGLKPVASFSGGKDSLVALHIALRAGVEPDVLFNDTGLELPPVPPYVKDVAKRFGLELTVADAQDLFYKGLEVFGPPGKDFRWCCKVVKMSPIGKIYKTRYREGTLTIVGQRAYESIERSRSGAVWRNRWLPSALNISPIQDWDQLTVWAYIRREGLTPNPLYMLGFDRLGCFMCPAGNIAEYHMIKKLFPGIWREWEEALEKWRKRLGMSSMWVRYHLWRWLNPNAQGRRRIEEWLGVKRGEWRSEYVKRSGIEVRVTRSGSHLKLTVTPPLSLEGIRAQWRVISTSIVEEEECVRMKMKEGELKVCSGSDKSVINSSSMNDVLDALRLTTRWSKCVGCRNCETWCPEEAISVESRKPVVKPEKCSGCKVCLEVCPVAEVLVNKVIAPQVLGDSKGAKRRKVSVSVELARRKSMKGAEPPPSFEGLKKFFRDGENSLR